MPTGSRGQTNHTGYHTNYTAPGIQLHTGCLPTDFHTVFIGSRCSQHTTPQTTSYHTSLCMKQAQVTSRCHLFIVNTHTHTHTLCTQVGVALLRILFRLCNIKNQPNMNTNETIMYFCLKEMLFFPLLKLKSALARKHLREP